HYMAPEQAKGAPVDGRADQYALGVVGYRMVTAELPFSGDSIHTILYKHIFEEPPLVSAKRPEAPASLTAAIARALSKNPEARFPTMEDFATAVWPEQPVAAPRRSIPAAAAPAAAAATVPLRATPPRPGSGAPRHRGHRRGGRRCLSRAGPQDPGRSGPCRSGCPGGRARSARGGHGADRRHCSRAGARPCLRRPSDDAALAAPPRTRAAASRASGLPHDRG